MEITISNLWGTMVNGIQCSYTHIVSDVQALGSVAADIAGNIGLFVKGLM